MTSYDFDVISDTPQPRHATALNVPPENAPPENAPPEKALAEKALAEKNPAETARAEARIGPVEKRDQAA